MAKSVTPVKPRIRIRRDCNGEYRLQCLNGVGEWTSLGMAKNRRGLSWMFAVEDAIRRTLYTYGSERERQQRREEKRCADGQPD